MSPSTLLIGSRGSQLARAQSAWVKAELESHHPDLEVKIVIIKTSGDVFNQAPLNQIGGKGLFTKEIEESLLRKKIDLAVHSLKDLPTTLPPRLCLAAVTRREDVRDAFISNKYESMEELPPGAVVGTSSLRRQSQLLQIRRDLDIRNLRGNVDTRLRKLDEGQYEAILLACAGLIRLGLAHRIIEKIPVEQVCPAIGQGALGIEARVEDAFTLERLRCLNHQETRLATEAERAFLKRLGGGCQVPIAAYARAANGQLKLDGVIASIDGKQAYRHSAQSDWQNAEGLGIGVAESLLSQGAWEALAVSG